MDFLKLALQATINDIFESFKDSNEDFHLTDRGENLILIPKNKIDLYNIMQEMVKDNENIVADVDAEKSIGVDVYGINSYSSYVSDDVKIIKNINLQKILEIQDKLLDSPEFMGIIIYDRETKMTLNISHFLILLQLLLDENFYKILNKNFDIFIFKKNQQSSLAKKEIEIKEFKKYSKETVEEINKIQQSWLNDIIKIAAIGINLTKGVKLPSEIRNYDIRNFVSITEEINPFEMNTLIDISFHTKINDYNIIVPVHTLVYNGEFIPYFGVAPVIPGETTKGLNLHFTGLLTGNISSDIYITTSVCTGNYDNRTLTGLLTLSKINANSMFFNGIINSVFPFWLDKVKIAAKDINQKILNLK
ncbi:MAG: hypothetical protein GXO49_05855 [Chlorobi bacterium]|nr:hypothetical protein [Chlorobiota bacterium]